MPAILGVVAKRNGAIHPPANHPQCMFQVRSNKEALEQLIEGAEAIPHVVQLLAPGRDAEMQEQGALLLSMLTSQFLEAKVSAVQVRPLISPLAFPHGTV